MRLAVRMKLAMGEVARQHRIRWLLGCVFVVDAPWRKARAAKGQKRLSSMAWHGDRKISTKVVMPRSSL